MTTDNRKYGSGQDFSRGAGNITNGTFVRKDFRVMDLKKLATGALVIALGATLFIGCAKPPTEKVDALNAQFAQLQEKGAQVFAQAQYDQVSAQMTELQSLMDQKKYKEHPLWLIPSPPAWMPRMPLSKPTASRWHRLKLLLPTRKS